ncbi:hypothetical protein SEPCBS119000_001439 [Sporothrix epigloea]|uniref:Protein kinase domain-containing protein n=1 Tax=Sporothrix epigloea TaxID=1892477 RepID=A0ABP0DAN6_9PEZI
MDERAELLRLIAEERARREEVERRVLAEQALRKEERLRREQAESRCRALREETERRMLEEAKRSQPQKLLPFLEACHSLSLATQSEAGRFETRNSEPPVPSGRLYPRRMIPWLDFQARQDETWKQLADPSFTDQHIFPSQYMCDCIQSQIKRIGSEPEACQFESDTVESAVQNMINLVNDNTLLQDRLGLQGTVTFGSHPTSGIDDDDESESFTFFTSQFWIYENLDGRKFAKTAIENISPHDLTQDVVNKGLVSEIQPLRDVINESGKDSTSAPRARATAAVTQLFSRMIAKGIQYGYVGTGQTYVFLYIPDDPSIVYYHVSVPNKDVRDDDECRLHKTAVGQVFAFVLRSLPVESPPQSWYDAAAKLGVWPVETEDVHNLIHKPVCEGEEPRASARETRHRRNFTRSPIRTRSHSKQSKNESRRRDDIGNEAVPPPLHQSTCPGKIAAASVSVERQAQDEKATRQRSGPGQEDIQNRPYCTHGCLLGLAYGGPMDVKCPNAGSHGPRHIGRTKFLRLVRAQLAKDRGPEADVMPLHLSGAIGALFKVRLSTYGYTLVAKGAKRSKLEFLEHEKKVYDQLRPIQGKHVPVCIGLTDLILPYHYDGRVFENLLFLSWGGRPLYRCLKELNEKAITAAVISAYASLHQLHVFHADAEVRNITYDGTPLIVDFERAKLRRRQPLGAMSRNRIQKRKSDMVEKQRDYLFAQELRLVAFDISTYYNHAREKPMPTGSGVVGEPNARFDRNTQP